MAAAKTTTAAGVADAAAWIDQHFTLHALADLAEGLSRAPEAEGVVIDPFDPHLGWKRGERMEHEHVGEAVERVRTFARAYRLGCWLIAPPVAVFDPPPVPPMWAVQFADAAVVIYQGKAYRYQGNLLCPLGEDGDIPE